MHIDLFRMLNLYSLCFPLVLCLIYRCCANIAQVQKVNESDKLQGFYTRIKGKDVKYCQDHTKLLPDCSNCIPGLERSNTADINSPCDRYIKASESIRNEIADLTRQRYGAKVDPSRPFGLYPYLELPDFMTRQIKFGKMISDRKAENIIDIGSYYNPIHLFLEPDFCPTSITIVEPILDPLSAIIPCLGSKAQTSTHVIILPITFKYYMEIKHLVPSPDAVVCIGCDSHYGPNRRMLETAFKKPYTLFIEYPSEYVHNAPFKKMMGTADGEKMTYHFKFQPNTNQTQYTKRVMKVIEYSPI